MAITILMAVSIFSMADDIVITRTADSKKFEYARGRIPEGVKVTLALLESCTSIDYGSTPFQADDLKKREGDHIRIQFPKDVTVTLGNAKVVISELVFTQPINTGVFWLKSGDKLIRCSKYRFEKADAFVKWRDQP